MANRPVRIVGAILATLLVVAVLAGVGLMAYNAGVTQGMVTSGQLVAPGAAPETGAQAVPYARPFLWAPFGFGWGFGILRGLFGLFIGLLVFGLIVRLLVGGLFGWRRWGRFGGGPGHWREGGGAGGVPPMFEEWHRRAHGEEQAPKHEDKPQG